MKAAGSLVDSPPSACSAPVDRPGHRLTPEVEGWPLRFERDTPQIQGLAPGMGPPEAFEV
jgi:hypothetical protein